MPVQRIEVDLKLEEDTEVFYAREPSQDVICDFVDGQAFGDTIGVGIRSLSNWIVVEHAHTVSPSSVSEIPLLLTSVLT